MRVASDAELICVNLCDAAATDAAVVGSKAAQLARAGQAGLPIVPGMVMTRAAVERVRTGGGTASLDQALDGVWRAFGREGSVVVRSSSAIEDTAVSSMAGRFATVLHVDSREALRHAFDVVAQSGPEGLDAAMAVLVQPMVRARFGGVVFSADPLTGADDRVVVAAVRGGPDRLVSGAETGAHYVLSRRGRVRTQRDPIDGIGRRELRRIARLAARATAVAGAPQDIEWAIDDDGALLLLQSRPITTLPSRSRSRGRVYGPGPIAETFPDPLSRLEQDLWLPPIATAIDTALDLVGARRPRAATPTIVAIGGRLAVDLERLGVRRRRVRQLLDPRVSVRHLAAAWRVGRLRTVLPQLTAEQIETVDAQLSAVPALHRLDDRALLTVLDRTAKALVGLHGYEVLAVLLHDERATTSLAAVALAAAGRGRREGVADDDLAAAYPETLALSPPRIGRTSAAAPPTALTAPMAGEAAPTAGEDELTAREALRLRVRWVHELSARAAHELGARLAARGLLERAEHVRDVTLDDLRGAIETTRSAPLATDAVEPGPALPSEFHLADVTSGAVMPSVATDRAQRRRPRRAGGPSVEGLPASAGRACGVAWDGRGPRPDAPVLVVRTLDPQLATVLPDCVALVAETGNVLSHLAILAREYRIPAVVALAGAVEAYPSGTALAVDGDRGRVMVAASVPDLASSGARPCS